jgi:hypothetical protein
VRLTVLLSRERFLARSVTEISLVLFNFQEGVTLGHTDPPAAGGVVLKVDFPVKFPQDLPELLDEFAFFMVLFL